ncbi:hypothetical protein NKJ88_01340 [Mesorhizobium sp. M0016]
MVHEELGILVLRAVVGVGVKDQLRIGQMLLQVIGIDGRHDDVRAAVHPQDGLLDVHQIGEALTFGLTPFADRRHLCRCDHVADIYAAIDGARAVAIEKFAGGGLALL